MFRLLLPHRLSRPPALKHRIHFLLVILFFLVLLLLAIALSFYSRRCAPRFASPYAASGTLRIAVLALPLPATHVVH